MPKDVLVLGAGHSLMLPHFNYTPQNIAELGLPAVGIEKSLEKFGLFESASPNFNTYHPGVKPEDLVVTEGDIVKPVFRLLSAGLIRRPYDAVDFSDEKVLKASMPKMLGQTVYPNHEMLVGNEIGSVGEVFWQESYRKDNIKVPAGINGIFHIDAKSHPKIARGLSLDPPTIHSNSVTVAFNWEPSHKFDTNEAFFNKLGTIAEDGKLVRRVVTEITAYYETSLVPHGADRFAKIMGKDGKIQNPKLTDRGKFSFNPEEEAKQGPRYYFIDFKDLESFSEEPSTLSEPIINPEDKSTNMKEVILLVSQLFAVQLAEDTTEETLTQVLRTEVDKLSAKVKDAETLTTQLQDAQSKLTKAEQDLAALQQKAPMIALGETTLTETRNEVKRLYGLLKDEKSQDVAILTAIENGDLAYLNAVKKDYAAQVDKKYPMSCKSCNSTDISRASAAVGEEGGKNEVDTFQTNREVVDKILAKKTPALTYSK